MAKPKHLKNAPIIEAIIDIDLKFNEDFNAEKILTLENCIKKDYPKKEELFITATGLTFKDGSPKIKKEENNALVGYQFISEDDKSLVKFRTDGLNYNKLKPYSDFDTLIEEVKRLWKISLEQVYPKIMSIENISLRYINKIDIPVDVKDLNEYFNAPPVLPKTLPQGLNKFLIVLDCTEENINSTIIQTIVKGDKPENFGYILDIEVSINKIEEDILWESFEKLRQYKNKIFFELITEKTMELLNE